MFAKRELFGESAGGTLELQDRRAGGRAAGRWYGFSRFPTNDGNFAGWGGVRVWGCALGRVGGWRVLGRILGRVCGWRALWEIRRVVGGCTLGRVVGVALRGASAM